jgi:hypothetical protein
MASHHRDVPMKLPGRSSIAVTSFCQQNKATWNCWVSRLDGPGRARWDAFVSNRWYVWWRHFGHFDSWTGDLVVEFGRRRQGERTLSGRHHNSGSHEQDWGCLQLQLSWASGVAVAIHIKDGPPWYSLFTDFDSFWMGVSNYFNFKPIFC